MMTDNRNSEHDVTSEVTEMQSNTTQPTNIFIRVFLTNLACLVVVVAAGWYFIIRPYMGSIESQLSETMTVTRGVAPKSDVEDLRRNIDELQAKVISLEQYGRHYAEILQDVRRINVQMKELDQKVSADGNKGVSDQSWRDELVNAINAAEPLTSFRENSLIPEKIREMLVGVDFVPTYKNISESWAKIRSNIKFQSQSEQKAVMVSEGWWDGAFLRSLFKVQRLDKNNLTPEEVFVRQVDAYLIENDSDGLIQWMDSYMSRFDGTTQALVKSWMDKLQRYQHGQSILRMVKRNK